MTQGALWSEWSNQAEYEECGRALGYDIFSRTQWRPDPAWSRPVHEGYLHAQASRVSRSKGDYCTNKWMQLRLGAFSRQRAVSKEVTPEFIASILVDECPVLRCPMTRGEASLTDASVDRLNNDGAYALGNLAFVSAKVNTAKGDLSFWQVLERAHSQEPSRGLEPIHWQRVAALMLGPCFASQPEAAPLVPMTVPIPNGTARLAIEEVQCLFASRCARPAGKNELVKLYRRCCPTDGAKYRLERLADRVHEALKRASIPWDIWLDPTLMRCLEEWRSSMPTASWNMVGDVSVGLLGGGELGHPRLNEWQLRQRGYVR